MITEPEDDYSASFYPYTYDTCVLSYQPVFLIESTEGPLCKSQPLINYFKSLFLNRLDYMRQVTQKRLPHWYCIFQDWSHFD